jgi:hypothetical protein
MSLKQLNFECVLEIANFTSTTKARRERHGYQIFRGGEGTGGQIIIKNINIVEKYFQSKTRNIEEFFMLDFPSCFCNSKFRNSLSLLKVFF